MPLRPLAVRVAILAAFLCHCAVLEGDGSDEAEDTIVGGSVDTDGGAVVALRIGTGSRAELCSATLIAPNVLLTARHCVSKTVQKTVICNSKGESENGPHFGDDHPVEDIHVYTGTKPNFDGPVAAGVREIVRPEGSVVCDKDIALVVLDKEITDITPMPVRMTRTASVKETIRSVGYGKTDNGSTGQRLRKTGVTVRAIGPGLSSSETALGKNEFEVGISICHGDSGGPAISQSTGAIIGVVSRGGDCNEDFGHVYTQTSGFADLIDRAITIAGAPPAQLEPDAPNDGKTAPSTTAPKSGESGGGCHVASGASNVTGPAAWAFGLALLLRRRRRA